MEHEKFIPQCLEPNLQNGVGKLNVWGCMSASGAGELRVLDRTVNSDYYIDILGSEMKRRAAYEQRFCLHARQVLAHK